MLETTSDQIQSRDENHTDHVITTIPLALDGIQGSGEDLPSIDGVGMPLRMPLEEELSNTEIMLFLETGDLSYLEVSNVDQP